MTVHFHVEHDEKPALSEKPSEDNSSKNPRVLVGIFGANGSGKNEFIRKVIEYEGISVDEGHQLGELEKMS